MTKVRRGNYVFLSWVGDHTPKHVHVYRNERLVLQWDLEHQKAMKGRASPRLVELIKELEAEGRL